MGFNYLKFGTEGRQLYRAVSDTRARLTIVEEEHQRLFDEGSPGLRAVRLDYASAVQEYANAVMGWLAWLERNREALSAPDARAAIAED